MIKPPAIPDINSMDVIKTIGLEPGETIEQVTSLHLQQGENPEHVSDTQETAQGLPPNAVQTIAEGAEQKDIPISSLVEEEKPDKITSLAQSKENQALEQFTAHGNQ